MNSLIDIPVQQLMLLDDGTFPNSNLPVLLYQKALEIPALLEGMQVKHLLHSNGWTNNWKGGIYTYHHYHSTTHEALAVIEGKATLLLGGPAGQYIEIQKGDLLVIPAGVAHKNTSREDDLVCIGGYPGGKDFDVLTGQTGERPMADRRIQSIPLPATGPLLGEEDELVNIWRKYSDKK